MQVSRAVGLYLILGIVPAQADPAFRDPAPSPSAPAIAVIIDDIGYRHRLDREAIELPGPLAVAILPHSPHAQSMSALARSLGKDVLIHLPMEAADAEDNRFLGPGALTAGMSRAEFVRTLAWDLRSVPGAIGVSNHMGSLLTRETTQMEWLMASLRIYEKFYVDSVTSHRSVAGTVAERVRVPHLRRDVFLDNSPEPAHIERQFDRLVEMARRRGSAVAIGHPRTTTIEVLERRLADLTATGVALVSLRSLIAAKRGSEATARASWSPGAPAGLR